MRSTRKMKPTGFPLPSAIELAQLAATLSPSESPDAAMEKAMAFYVEAVLFSRELQATEETLVARYGNSSRRFAALARLGSAEVERGWKDTMLLEPDQPDDEVRIFLRKRGLKNLKTGRAILENISRLLVVGGKTSESWRGFLARAAAVHRGQMNYRIPRRLLEALVHTKKARKSNQASRSAATVKARCAA